MYHNPSRAVGHLRAAFAPSLRQNKKSGQPLKK
uniref:Uncharacterized protein n=1 Tax=Ackermannviridae sp. TaxID=2831612 RepID=A0A8S5VQB1_9CAUD|nr:MAG TPA: protein of unknown function (DUF5083) [Ackermannviridae sp.]